MKIIGSYPKTRLRRLRKTSWIRNLVSETSISHNDLVLPIFVREGKNKIEAIKSMPGVKRYSIDKLDVILKQVKLSHYEIYYFRRLYFLSIYAFLIF